MKRALLALVLAVAPAAAAPPAGWKLDEALSLDLTRKAQRGSFFGGTETTKLAVEAYLAPSGGSLFLTHAEATPPADLRDGVATRTLFVLTQSAARQGSSQIETTVQRADPANKTLESSLTWRDPQTGIRQLGRTVVAADAQHLVAITGECMLPAGAAAELEQACAASLAALDPGIAPPQRVALAMIGAPAEPEPPSTPRMGDQPTIGDGARTPMTPMTISPAKREVDRRPIYLGGGIIVLAAIFWWNRKQRDRFDRESETGAKRTTPEPSSGDDDADDLQAAARGDDAKDES